MNLATLAPARACLTFGVLVFGRYEARFLVLYEPTPAGLAVPLPPRAMGTWISWN